MNVSNIVVENVDGYDFLVVNCNGTEKRLGELLSRVLVSQFFCGDWMNPLLLEFISERPEMFTINENHNNYLRDCSGEGSRKIFCFGGETYLYYTLCECHRCKYLIYICRLQC
jgi:hypothetical protein